MSSPARKIATTAPVRVGRDPREPAGGSSARIAPDVASGVSRTGLHLRFWIFAAAVVSMMVTGVVAISALRVQADYSIRSVQVQAARAQSDHAMLVNEVAWLSSPARVAAWARAQGMVAPSDAVILSIPGPAPGSPPGSSSSAPGGSQG